MKMQWATWSLWIGSTVYPSKNTQRHCMFKKIENEWILSLNLLIRQDLRDFLDILNTRFPDETGYMQSASRKR